MQALKAKFKPKKKGSDSDSDESFHCAGRPEDLANDFPVVDPANKLPTQEVFVPDDTDYYLYQSGLRRLSDVKPAFNTFPRRRSSHRATVLSVDSQSTDVDQPMLVIKTDGAVAPPRSNPPPRVVRFSDQVTYFTIPARESLIDRDAIPLRDLPPPPSPARSRRRQGMVFDVEDRLVHTPPPPMAGPSRVRDLPPDTVPLCGLKDMYHRFDSVDDA